jgi:hypothetical protein
MEKFPVYLPYVMYLAALVIIFGVCAILGEGRRWVVE